MLPAVCLAALLLAAAGVQHIDAAVPAACTASPKCNLSQCPCYAKQIDGSKYVRPAGCVPSVRCPCAAAPPIPRRFHSGRAAACHCLRRLRGGPATPGCAARVGAAARWKQPGQSLVFSKNSSLCCRCVVQPTASRCKRQTPAQSGGAACSRRPPRAATPTRSSLSPESTCRSRST